MAKLLYLTLVGAVAFAPQFVSAEIDIGLPDGLPTLESLPMGQVACGSDVNCAVRQIETQRRMQVHPSTYNIMRALIEQGPDAAATVQEGYQNSITLFNQQDRLEFALPIANTFSGVPVLFGFLTEQLNAYRIANRDLHVNFDFHPMKTNVVEKDGKLVDLNRVNREKFSQHPVFGLSDTELRTKHFNTKEGQASLEVVSYFTHRLGDVSNRIQQGQGDKKQLLSQFADEFSLSENEADAYYGFYRKFAKDYVGGKYVDTSSVVPSGSDFERNTDLFKSVVQRNIELQKREISLQKQTQDGSISPEDAAIEKSLIDKEKSEIVEDIQAVTLGQGQSSLKTAPEPDEPSDQIVPKRSIDDVLREADDKPLFINGRKVYAGARYKPAFISAKTTAEFGAALLGSLGEHEKATDLINVSNLSLQVTDAYLTLSNLPDDIDSFAKLTPALSSFTNILGAVSFIASLSKEDPQQKQMQAIMDALGAILINQQKIISGINNLQIGQAQIRRELAQIQNDLVVILETQPAIAELVSSGFQDLSEQVDRSYLDMSARLKRVELKGDLKGLMDELNFWSSEVQRDIEVFAPLTDDEKNIRLRELAIRTRDLESVILGVTEFADLFSPQSVSEQGAKVVNHTSGYRIYARNNSPNVQAQALERSSRLLASRPISSRLQNLSDIFFPFCSSCEKFKDLEFAMRMRGVLLMYLRIVEIMSLTENGRMFLKNATGQDTTFFKIGEGINELQVASAQARDYAPQALALYLSSLKELQRAILNYSDVALGAIGGYDTSWVWSEAPNTEDLDKESLPNGYRVNQVSNKIEYRQLEYLIPVVRKGNFVSLHEGDQPSSLKEGQEKHLYFLGNAETEEVVTRLKEDPQRLLETASWLGLGAFSKEPRIYVNSQKFPVRDGARVFSEGHRIITRLDQPLVPSAARLKTVITAHGGPEKDKLNAMVDRVVGEEAGWVSSFLGAREVQVETITSVKNGGAIKIGPYDEVKDPTPDWFWEVCDREADFVSSSPLRSRANLRFPGTLDHSIRNQEVSWNHYCITSNEFNWLDTWLTGDRFSVKPTQDSLAKYPEAEFLDRVKSPTHGSKRGAVGIREKIEGKFEEARKVVTYGVEFSVKDIRNEMISAWNKAVAYKGEVKPNFGSTVTLQRDSVNGALARQVLNRLPSLKARIEESRMILDTALRFGYGSDCLSSSPELTLVDNALSKNLFFGADRVTTVQEEGLAATYAEIDDMVKMLESLIELPDAEALKAACSVGYAGIETLSFIHSAIGNWMAQGAELTTK